MNNIKRIKVNAATVRFKSVSESNNGLMSPDDKILLDALLAATESPSETNITLTGPSTAEIKSELNVINNNLDNYSDKLTAIEDNLRYIEAIYCGRVWDESNSSPTAKTYCGSLEMLQKLPDILGLGGYLVQNDHTRRKLSKETHYKFSTGEEAKLDGSMGHYQWGWNRPFYITTWKEGNLFYECISLEPIKNRESYYVPVGSMSASGFATIDRETETLVSYCNKEPRYRGGNNYAGYDNTEKSMLGLPATYKNTEYFMTAARKNGQGWYAGTMRMNAVVQVLFHIIMGTRNSQADFSSIKNTDGLYSCGLGTGVCNLFVKDWNVWNTYNVHNPFVYTDECAELGDFIGVSDTREITYKDSSNQDKTDTYTIPVFFGLKHLFGYLWRINEDEIGVHTEDHNMIHYIRKSLYSEDYVYGTVNNSVIEGGSIPLGRTWIKNLSYKNLEMYPIVYNDNNGSANSYYCDLSYYTNDPTGASAIFRGDTAINDYGVGISAIFVDNGIVYANTNIGSPLCEFTEDFLLEPVIVK